MIDYPDDVRFLRDLPELAGRTDGEIQSLYREFSEENFAAGWLTPLDYSGAAIFAEWLRDRAGIVQPWCSCGCSCCGGGRR